MRRRTRREREAEDSKRWKLRRGDGSEELLGDCGSNSQTTLIGAEGKLGEGPEAK